MENYFIFDERELERVGLVCPACNTEAVFDLGKDHTAIVARECPGCGSHTFVEAFTTEAKQNYNWVTWYKKAREVKKNVGIRLYFRKPE